MITSGADVEHVEAGARRIASRSPPEVMRMDSTTLMRKGSMMVFMACRLRWFR
jgi:hypothetical protein